MCLRDLFIIVFHELPSQYLGQGSQDSISCSQRFCIQIYLSQWSLIHRQQLMKAFPPIFYGTAWKKQKTAELVELALKTGFRAIDTACQPKHYNQPGVGQGIYRSGIPRNELFIQTKYTPIDGQDPNNVPYNPKDSIPIQVKTSLEVSLKNLKTQYLDSLIIHSPMKSLQKTIEVWKVFEQFVKDGKVHHLGISNCYDVQFFKKLFQQVHVKPTFLQNRFYADSGYDKQLREFCRTNGIHYQSFWTLTANPNILQSTKMKQLVKRYNITSQQIFYLVLIGEGIIPLIGTCSKKHMGDDLSMLGIKLQVADREAIIKLLK